MCKEKKFLKVKKVSEERYFRDNGELIKFIEKQGGSSWEYLCMVCSNLSNYNKKASKNHK